MIRISCLIWAAIFSGCAEPALYVVSGDRIEKRLTPETPDAARGAILFEKRGDAHCVLCHQHEKSRVEFQGNLGPDLSKVSTRLSPAQIRLRIADYDAVKPGTTMPSYYRKTGFNQVDPKYSDKTVLSALEIEDIIAFLVRDENDLEH